MSLLQAFPRGNGGGGSAGVSSFNGRSGAVTPQAGDYSKSDVGLGNVDNTADADKPISTATQTALNGKINLIEKAAANGVATLDSNGKIPTSQIPDTAVLLTGTLTTTDWSNKTQTVSISGVNNTLKGTIGMLDSATTAQLQAAADAEIQVTAISTNSITFSCENVPSINIPFGVLITGGGELSTDHIHSTTEQRVGTWIDGKPIYEITIFDNSALPAGETLLKFLDYARQIISLNGTFEQYTNGSLSHVRSFPYQDSYGYTMVLDVQPGATNTKDLKVYKTGDWVTGNCIIVVQYTKTTDY